jgi:hypothetical protein
LAQENGVVSHAIPVVYEGVEWVELYALPEGSGGASDPPRGSFSP